MIENYISTHGHQFGFIKQHATDMSIYTVKRVLYSPKTVLYTCFFSALRAFDRLITGLFNKPIACNTH